MESEQNEINVEINGPITAADNGSLTNSSVSMMDGATSQMDELVRNSHKVPYFYRQDIVRHNKSGSIGIVHDIAGDSDSDSSIADDNDYDDDEDDDDDGDENEEGEGDDGDDHVDDNKNGDEDKGGDSYKGKRLQADQVRILWLDDTEQIQHVNNITLIDRGFLHGDYVASALEPTGQVGLVQDVNISVDLLAPDGSIVQNVSSRDLKRVREFAVGDYVVLGPWLGRVDDVLDNVVVLVDDGSLCKVIGADPLHLKPISKNYLDEDGQFPYYPGQRVRASSSSVFKNSRWLSGLWKANRLEGTVTKVTVGSLYIHWIASAGYGPNSSTVPAEKQSPKNLKLLSCFAHANWQVGDWCVVPLSVLDSSSITLDKNLSKLWLHDFTKTESQLENGCDSEEVTQEGPDEVNELMDLDQADAPDANGVRNSALPESSSCRSSTSVTKDPVHETRHLHRKKIRKVVIRKDKKARKKEEKFEKAFLIVKTRTTIHVAWQDGTIGHEVDSKMLIPIDSPGDHEFVAEQYVVEKASDDIDSTSEPKRVGVVRNVNAKERTACVRWLKPVEQMEDPCEFDVEEIVSVYELESHPDYDYTYGDVVVRLSPVSVSALSNEESAVETKQQIGEGKSQRFAGSKKGENPSGDDASMDSLSLSWVGNITGLRNGDIEVMWADGMISTVGPQAILVVGRDDDDSIADGSEVSDDSASWETVNDDENPQEEVGPADASSMNPEVEEIRENGNFGRNPALSLPLAAIDFVTRLAAGIFSRRKNEDQGFSNSKGKDEFQSEERDSSDESSSQKSNVINNYCAETTHEKGEECADDDAPVTSNAAEGSGDLNGEIVEDAIHLDDDTSHFKRFDTAKDPLDHHFLGSSGQISNGRKWLKKVQQDWDILQNNLPDGIYVRVYEDQMDLLRAVIVGAYGTPYQDGLFFFDFYLPPDYPDVPPSAHYHSGGWRINPNLYEEGKVCLSLLNTWTGRGNEVWDPKSSSILQVLVSLQGLVLNSKPYFNEAGYDKQIGTPEGEKNSVSYNENTFLLNCKTMMYLMRRPPKDFEELVKEHFKKRGFYILRACDAYMKGGLIGSLSKDASISIKDNSNSTSVGFKLMLDKIMPKLYSALIDVGADCLDFKHLLHPEK